MASRRSSAPAPRGRRGAAGATAPGDESRRGRLTGSAIEMFTRYGVRKTSIDDIARAAGIAKGSVYLEFRSKEELFRAAAEQVAAQIVEDATTAAAGDGPLEERVTGVLMAKFWRLYDLVHSRPHAAELMDARASHAADVFRRADDRFREIVVGVLQAATGGDRRHRRSRVAEVATVLLMAAHGASYGAGALDETGYRQRLRLAVELVLAGAELAREHRVRAPGSQQRSTTPPAPARP